MNTITVTYDQRVAINKLAEASFVPQWKGGTPAKKGEYITRILEHVIPLQNAIRLFNWLVSQNEQGLFEYPSDFNPEQNRSPLIREKTRELAKLLWPEHDHESWRKIKNLTFIVNMALASGKNFEYINSCIKGIREADKTGYSVIEERI